MTHIADVAPGLRRWTALHEEWREEVASLALETEDGLVLIDPIDPPRGMARPDHVLLTVFWHGRSAAELGTPQVWASRRAVRRLQNRGVEVTDTGVVISAPSGTVRLTNDRISINNNAKIDMRASGLIDMHAPVVKVNDASVKTN